MSETIDRVQTGSDESKPASAPKQPAANLGYNPFEHLDPKVLDFGIGAAAIAELVILDDPRDNHFINAARHFVAGIHAFLKSQKDGLLPGDDSSADPFASEGE